MQYRTQSRNKERHHLLAFRLLRRRKASLEHLPLHLSRRLHIDLSQLLPHCQWTTTFLPDRLQWNTQVHLQRARRFHLLVWAHLLQQLLHPILDHFLPTTHHRGIILLVRLTGKHLFLLLHSQMMTPCPHHLPSEISLHQPRNPCPSAFPTMSYPPGAQLHSQTRLLTHLRSRLSHLPHLGHRRQILVNHCTIYLRL